MRVIPTLLLATAAGLSLLSAAPALGQTVEELTVTGRALRQNPQSLSARVSYADLNLAARRDRRVLVQRINATAGRLCTRLNEPSPTAGNLGHSCQEVAVRDAMGQVRLAVANAGSYPEFALSTASPSAGNYYEGASTSAPSPAYDYASPASATVSTSTVTNGPVPDTPQNRARFGPPLSNAGKRTAARGN